MTTIPAYTICLSCVHHHGVKPTQTCDAFPTGIPERYLSGEQEHTKPDPEDNGIQYELDESMLW